MRKILILAVVFSMLSLNGSLIFAKDEVIDPSLYEVEATDAQIDAYYNKIGEQRPYSTLNKAAASNVIGNVVDNLIFVKQESTSDSSGRITSETKYYKYTFKDSDEANTIQDTIESQQIFTPLNSLNTPGFTPNSFFPSEGDFRIHIAYDPLNVTTKFDSSTQNYRSAFLTETYRSPLQLAAGFIKSHPIIGFFTGAVLNNLIDGFKGKGDATGYQRLVVKYGQVYRNNQWRSYFETYQRETYWKHETFSYNSNGSLKSAVTNYYLPSTSGTSYWPFMWMRTGSFSKNNEIAEIALYQYSVEPNRSTPVLDFYRYEGGLENWATVGSFPY
ncbi:hypothetical protein ACFOQM_05620 [Paenibacillus sp. GCM10012307]|uniref:Uncharacterized protein n=1 Tax=Paenibacillus roseus TaxID=2798579 RepID=A0A934J3F6_9BACL|nr:hypothetical protein [Paenibacillus roseus]MBJ6360783.1 hypothetical protein [Paenibacillus roseus]